MQLADKFIHPTIFTGEYPHGWGGYTFLNYDPKSKCYHPGDDYNKGGGADDLGQDVVVCGNGVVFFAQQGTTGYGNIVIVKHQIGYNLKRFIKETYGIETDTLYSLYGHLQSFKVKAGDELSAGDLIGKLGQSGTVSPHLHFEIYHLGGELQHTGYRFYPVGWTEERIKENWLPAYKFIEAVKQIESFEQFLGKPKDYWLQIEKDRETLLSQVGNKDQEIIKIKEPLETRIKTLETQNQQMEAEIAKHPQKLETALQSIKNDRDNLKSKLDISEGEVIKLQNKVASLLLGKESELNVGVALDLLSQAFKKLLPRKGS